jgi:hypothetical protein
MRIALKEDQAIRSRMPALPIGKIGISRGEMENTLGGGKK